MPLSTKKGKCKVERTLLPEGAQATMSAILNEVARAAEDGLVTKKEYEETKVAFLEAKRNQIERSVELHNDFLRQRLEREEAARVDLDLKKSKFQVEVHRFQAVMGSSAVTRRAKESAEDFITAVRRFCAVPKSRLNLDRGSSGNGSACQSGGDPKNAF